MAPKKRFLLRIAPELYTELERWASDDFRSVNAQIEFLLREAVHRGRKRRRGPEAAATEEFPDPADFPESRSPKAEPGTDRPPDTSH